MHLRRSLSIAILLLGSLAPAAASAQASDASKAAARQLTVEGYDALEKKDYAGAAERFTRADTLFHAPTITLGLARAYVGLGKLASAQEAYSKVTHETIPPNASAAFTNAVADAQRELDALRPRVPTVILNVKGPKAPTLTLDGAEVPSAVIGVKMPLDPGKHVIRASAPGFAPAEAALTIAEGKTVTLTLEMVPGAAPPPATAPTQDAPADGGKPSVLKPIGFAVLGVGAAGIIVGGITAGLAAGKHSSLVKQCPDGHCAPSLQPKLQSDVDGYHTLSAVSSASFIAGGVLAAGGLILALTAPKAKPQAAWVSPVVGLGYAGVEGAF